MADIKNPDELKGVDAVILFDGSGKIWGVHPDEVDVWRGESVTWVIPPPKTTTVSFASDHSPLDWKSRSNADSGMIIRGTVRKDAEIGPYKYTVTVAGGNTLDPRIRVKG